MRVRIAGDARNALYEFELRSATMPLMSGRTTVVLDANYRRDPMSAPATQSIGHGRQRRASAPRSAGAWPPRDTSFTCTPIAGLPPPRRRCARSLRPAAEAQVDCLRRDRRRGDPSGAWRRCWKLAPIQILVNNAGMHDDAAFPGMSAQQWRRVIDVSINGFYNVTQTLMLPMIRTRWGRVDQHLLGQRTHRQSRTSQLRRCKGRAECGHQSAESRSGEPRHHRQRGRAGHHFRRHGRFGLRCGRHCQAGPDETRRLGRGSGRPGRLSRLGGGRLHHRSDHFNQRRNDLKGLAGRSKLTRRPIAETHAEHPRSCE